MTGRRLSFPIYIEGECPDFRRASHMAICVTCGKEFWRHQQYSWGDPHFLLYLHRLCDGSYIKP